MFGPTLTTAIIQAMQKALNTALRYDPGTQQQLRQLSGKRLAIESTDPQFICHAEFIDFSIQLSGYSEQPADCQLSGKLVDMFALLNRNTQSLANSGVEVRGDIAVLARLQTILKQLDIDWEEALNDVLGDSAGHLLATFQRQKMQWFKQRISDIPEWLPEYLSEELQIIPSQFELEQFYSNVHQLHQDCDRLNAKIDRLKQQVSTSSAKKP